MQNLSSLLVLTGIVISISELGGLVSPVIGVNFELERSNHNHKSWSNETEFDSGQESGSALHQLATAARSSSRQAHFVQQLDADRLQQVAVGRPAKFRCVVEDIGDHKVS